MKTKDTISLFTSMILALLGLLILCMNLHSVLPYVLVAIPPTIFMVIIAYQDIKTRYIPPVLSASLLFCGIPIAAFNWLACYNNGTLWIAIISSLILIAGLIYYVKITGTGGGDRDIYIVLALIAPIYVIWILLASLILGVIGSIYIVIIKNRGISGLTTKEKLTMIPSYTPTGKRTMTPWEMPFALPTCIVWIAYLGCFLFL